MKLQTLIDSGAWDTFEDKGYNWHYISSKLKLPESFIEKFSHKVIWDKIIKYQNLSMDFINKYVDDNNLRDENNNRLSKIDMWENLIRYQNLSEEFLEENKLIINIFHQYDTVLRYQENLSDKLLREFAIGNFSAASSRKNLPIDFIIEFKNKLQWNLICQCHILSKEFCDTFKDDLNVYILHNKSLTLNIFNRFRHRFPDSSIRDRSPYLPEEILENVSPLIINWFGVCKVGNFSEKFLIKNMKYISFGDIPLDRELSDKFIIKTHYKDICHLSISSYDKKYHHRILKNYKVLIYNFPDLFSHYFSPGAWFFKDIIKIHHKINWKIHDKFNESTVTKFRHAMGIDNIMANGYITQSIKNKISKLENISS